MLKDHIPAILQNEELNIVGVVEPNSAIAERTAKELGIPAYSSISDIKDFSGINLAIVCVPHNQYLPILKVLAENRVATLKEKPLGMTLNEAKEIVDLYKKNNTFLQICVQRRFSKLYDTAKELLNRIGNIYSLYAEYTLNLKSMSPETQGWRADVKISGGGAALDLGYHTIDLLTYLFGTPDIIYAKLNYNSLSNDYTIDDTLKAMMTYDNGRINGNILTTKIFLRKGERIRIFGSKGAVYLDNRKVTLFDRDLKELEIHQFTSKDGEVESQLKHFVDKASAGFRYDSNLKDQMTDMRVIDAIYKSDRTGESVRLR